LGTEDGLLRTEPAALLRPHPQHHTEIPPERGPVAVHVEYLIPPADAADFVAAAQAMQRIRRRDGALSWGLFEDAAVPGRYVETFVVESWAEHLRQHHRGTAEDTTVVARVRAYHHGDAPPRVTHWVAVDAAGEAVDQVI